MFSLAYPIHVPLDGAVAVQIVVNARSGTGAAAGQDRLYQAIAPVSSRRRHSEQPTALLSMKSHLAQSIGAVAPFNPTAHHTVCSQHYHPAHTAQLAVIKDKPSDRTPQKVHHHSAHKAESVRLPLDAKAVVPLPLISGLSHTQPPPLVVRSFPCR